MKSQINILRQLQELVLTRDEHHQTGDGAHLDSLNDAIDAMQEKLDPQAAGLYSRLYKKNHIVLSAMTNGCCSLCGMQIPTAQSQQVRLGQHLVTCSGCGRILYAAGEGSAQNVAEPPDRDDPRTGISRFTAEELMATDLKATTREDAIAELAALMEGHNFISNADALASAAMDREAVLSTAVGGGLAFPHVRGVEGGALTLAAGVSRNGIDWDGEKVRLVFLSAIPLAAAAFYMRLMSGMVQAFSKKENFDAAVSAADGAALWKVLVKATRHYVK
jgi:mannitol/fructose-specific phosphotransferase system IIA component (Ntr-type)